MKTDMSPEAISRRLNDLNEISELCMTLSKARVVRDTSSKTKSPAKPKPIKK